MDVTRTLIITLDSQAEERYPRVVFDLPPGDDSFEVTLGVRALGAEGGTGDADGAAAGVTIDLGCEGPDGWRGWSGGARTSFIVGEDDSTPGYLPGTVRPGRWFVVLGVHTVPREGAEVSVRIVSPVPVGHRPDHGPRPDPATRTTRGSDRDLPAPPGLRWYAGDLHAHSLHSDGTLSLWELANEGVRSGLDFLAVTEHNTVSHHAHLAAVGARQGITLLPGQEVTTHMGHANAYGRIGFVDFRRPAREWVREVRNRGGLLSVNHPVAGDCSWIQELGSEEPPAAEVWHGTWYLDPPSRAVIAWLQRWRQDLVVLGGGDFHNRSTPLRPGMPTTWVAAEECTEDALLDGLRRGRTTVTSSVRLVSVDGGGAPSEARPVLSGTPILLRGEGEDLHVMDARGCVLVALDGSRRAVDPTRETIEAPRRLGPYRLEDASRMVLALSA